jgi:hypothetical protein
MIEFDYNHYYPKSYFINGSLYGMNSWNKRTLKFGDGLPGICYALGISFETFFNYFTEVYSKNAAGFTEDHTYTIEDIETFLISNKKRNPTILEIGGGRGELSVLMSKLNIQHTSIDVCLEANDLYEMTGKKFYGNDFIHQAPIVAPIEKLLLENTISLKDFDTLLFVESIEHIPSENFKYVFSRIIENFHGRFIVTNDFHHHPIIGTLDNPGDPGATIPEHIATINDTIYDSWCEHAKSIVYRNLSHLVLEF